MNVKINTKDNFELDAVFNRIKDSKKGVILAHGMTVDKNDKGVFVRAEPKLNEIGFTTLRFDFRSHGKSQGNSVNDFTISGEMTDLEAVVGFLKNEGITWVGLAGASFGGGISALYSGKCPNDIQALFLANPCINYEKGFLEPTTLWAKEHFQNVFERIKKHGFIKIGSRQFKVGRKLFDEMRIYKPCKELIKYTGPLLIVHGKQDSKVALQDVVECFDELPNPVRQLEIINGAEHGFHTEPFETQVTDMIVSFFVESAAT